MTFRSFLVALIVLLHAKAVPADEVNSEEVVRDYFYTHAEDAVKAGLAVYSDLKAAADKGSLGEIEVAAKRALEIRPRADIYEDMARLHIYLGNVNSAIHFLQLCRGTPGCDYSLSVIYASLGRDREAEVFLNSAAESGYVDARRARNILRWSRGYEVGQVTNHQRQNETMYNIFHMDEKSYVLLGVTAAGILLGGKALREGTEKMMRNEAKDREAEPAKNNNSIQKSIATCSYKITPWSSPPHDFVSMAKIECSNGSYYQIGNRRGDSYFAFTFWSHHALGPTNKHYNSTDEAARAVCRCN